MRQNTVKCNLKKNVGWGQKDTDKQTRINTDRHRHTRIDTDRHRKTQTDTERHRQTQTDTDTNNYTDTDLDNQHRHRTGSLSIELQSIELQIH